MNQRNSSTSKVPTLPSVIMLPTASTSTSTRLKRTPTPQRIGTLDIVDILRQRRVEETASSSSIASSAGVPSRATVLTLGRQPTLLASSQPTSSVVTPPMSSLVVRNNATPPTASPASTRPASSTNAQVRPVLPSPVPIVLPALTWTEEQAVAEYKTRVASSSFPFDVSIIGATSLEPLAVEFGFLLALQLRQKAHLRVQFAPCQKALEEDGQVSIESTSSQLSTHTLHARCVILLLTSRVLADVNCMQALRLAVAAGAAITLIKHCDARWRSDGSAAGDTVATPGQKLGLHDFPPLGCIPPVTLPAFDNKALEHSRDFWHSFFTLLTKRLAEQMNSPQGVSSPSPTSSPPLSSSPSLWAPASTSDSASSSTSIPSIRASCSRAVTWSAAHPTSMLLTDAGEATRPDATSDIISANQPLLPWLFDFFLSHKRTSSADFCRALRESLFQARYSAFLDQEDTGNLGSLLANVRRSRCLLLVLAPDILESDWCMAELMTAVMAGCQVRMVVTQGATWIEEETGRITDEPSGAMVRKAMERAIKNRASPAETESAASQGDNMPSRVTSAIDAVVSLFSDPSTFLRYSRSYHSSFVSHLLQSTTGVSLAQRAEIDAERTALEDLGRLPTQVEQSTEKMKSRVEYLDMLAVRDLKADVRRLSTSKTGGTTVSPLPSVCALCTLPIHPACRLHCRACDKIYCAECAELKHASHGESADGPSLIGQIDPAWQRRWLRQQMEAVASFPVDATSSSSSTAPICAAIQKSELPLVADASSHRLVPLVGAVNILGIDWLIEGIVCSLKQQAAATEVSSSSSPSTTFLSSEVLRQVTVLLTSTLQACASTSTPISSDTSSPLRSAGHHLVTRISRLGACLFRQGRSSSEGSSLLQAMESCRLLSQLVGLVAWGQQHGGLLSIEWISELAASEVGLTHQSKSILSLDELSSYLQWWSTTFLEQWHVASLPPASSSSSSSVANASDTPAARRLKLVQTFARHFSNLTTRLLMITPTTRPVSSTATGHDSAMSLPAEAISLLALLCKYHRDLPASTTSSSQPLNSNSHQQAHTYWTEPCWPLWCCLVRLHPSYDAVLTHEGDLAAGLDQFDAPLLQAWKESTVAPASKKAKPKSAASLTSPTITPSSKFLELLPQWVHTINLRTQFAEAIQTAPAVSPTSSQTGKGSVAKASSKTPITTFWVANAKLLFDIHPGQGQRSLVSYLFEPLSASVRWAALRSVCETTFMTSGVWKGSAYSNVSAVHSTWLQLALKQYLCDREHERISIESSSASATRGSRLITSVQTWFDPAFHLRRALRYGTPASTLAGFTFAHRLIPLLRGLPDTTLSIHTTEELVAETIFGTDKARFADILAYFLLSFTITSSRPFQYRLMHLMLERARSYGASSSSSGDHLNWLSQDVVEHVIIHGLAGPEVFLERLLQTLSAPVATSQPVGARSALVKAKNVGGPVSPAEVCIFGDWDGLPGAYGVADAWACWDSIVAANLLVNERKAAAKQIKEILSKRKK